MTAELPESMASHPAQAAAALNEAAEIANGLFGAQPHFISRGTEIASYLLSGNDPKAAQKREELGEEDFRLWVGDETIRTVLLVNQMGRKPRG